MDFNSFVAPFSRFGSVIMSVLLGASLLLASFGAVNIFRKDPFLPRQSRKLFFLVNTVFTAGFLLICWFHYRIYSDLALVIPDNLVVWLNRQLEAMNAQAAYAFKLYDPQKPPRYMIPLWIENEKYYFWFMCYAFMAYRACKRLLNHRFQGVLMVFLGVQVAILSAFANPFTEPLPRFFQEIGPWFDTRVSAMQQFGMFMKLYPKMTFYYNASYMWMHPPMLFLSYGAITITFITSSFMLVRRELEIEILGYDYAKFGYFMLTLGMLLGYPWALQAWGPNWWWDPKICSSIMMWAIYSTYLHTRLYANKKSMWYFTSILGILCFLAMLFTFITSFYFPGEHTFQ